MRALVCRSLEEGIDGLRVEELSAPALGPGEVRFRVHAAGINFADTLLVRGEYQVKPALPFAPGLEASGVVGEVGEGVTHVRPGDRVLAFLDHGGFAEEAVAASSDVVALPDGMDFVTAAGFLVVYGTAYLALASRARLQPGEVLVVFGASGGAGLTAVEVGHALGARVIAVTSSAENIELARQHGAGLGINYRTEDVGARIEALTGGADVVYDPVGGDLFDAALRCVRPGGRILVIGFASGRVPRIPANHLLVKDAAALGFSLGQLRAHQPEAVREAMAELLALYAEGRLQPHVSRVLTLDEAPEGLRTLASGRTTGKLVVRITE